MTVVLGLRAVDGVVLVADGQATAGHGDTATRTATEKLSALHGRVAYGCAGQAGVRQIVDEQLKEDISEADCRLPIKVLRPKLVESVTSVQHKAAGQYVRLDFMGDRPEGLSVLFAGVSEAGEPWLLEITKNGESEVHPVAEAIGIGRHYASYALMSAEHYGLSDRELNVVRLLAYRAVDDAIRTAAADLGPPIGMYVVTADGAKCQSEEDLGGVRQAVQIWQAHEREIFGQAETWIEQARRPARAQSGGIEPPPPAPRQRKAKKAAK
ncbi:MAG: proteasome beta subunit [Acidobacteria bacterium]|nr:proteasome beta subunit [Acidobacteriota bacterium]